MIWTPCITHGAQSSRRVALDKTLRTYGLSPSYRSDSTVVFCNKDTTIVFHAGSRKLLLDGLLVWLNGPVIQSNGSWTSTEADVSRVLAPLLSPLCLPKLRRPSIVVVDPGHGGRDTGAIGRRRVYEKKVVLDIARRVRRKLLGFDVNVKLTRKRDQNLSLAERTERAARWGAGLFISIHVNSARNPDASGLETYVLPAPGFPSTSHGRSNVSSCPANRYDPESMLLSYCVHRQILAHTKGTDRGIRRARFHVLRSAPCPAILIECGFLSNPIEEKKMIQRAYRNALAEGISNGIIGYISTLRTR